MPAFWKKQNLPSEHPEEYCGSRNFHGCKKCLKTNLLPQRAKKSVFEMIFGIQNLIRKEKMAILGSKKRSVVV